MDPQEYLGYKAEVCRRYREECPGRSIHLVDLGFGDGGTLVCDSLAARDICLLGQLGVTVIVNCLGVSTNAHHDKTHPWHGQITEFTLDWPDEELSSKIDVHMTEIAGPVMEALQCKRGVLFHCKAGRNRSPAAFHSAGILWLFFRGMP